MLRYLIFCLIVSLCSANAGLIDKDSDAKFPIKAFAFVAGNIGTGKNAKFLMGEVTFWQKSKESKVDMLVNITFQDPKPTRQYNLNVHEFGITFNHLDSAIRCLSVGDHYNPTNVTHGMPSDAAHHLGDLGDVKAMEDGNIFFDIKDIDIKLCGPKSVIGRSVVLSSKPEVMDLSENESNSKKKNMDTVLACGDIVFAKV